MAMKEENAKVVRSGVAILPQFTATTTAMANVEEEAGWNSLPLEIQFEILARVPALDLIGLKPVCKSWFNLISSNRYFSYAQLARCRFRSRLSILLDEHQYVSGQQGGGSFRYHYLAFETDGGGSAQLSTAELLHNRELNLEALLPWASKQDEVYVLSSCDGLILFSASSSGNFSENLRLFVCNPVIALSAMLPSPPADADYEYEIRAWALGYDDSAAGGTIRYKVVGIRRSKSYPHKNQLVLFTLGCTSLSSSWRVIDIENDFNRYRSLDTVVANGKLNWMCSRCTSSGGCESYLLSIDMNKEVVTEEALNLPRTLLCIPPVGFFGVHGCLYLVFPPWAYNSQDMQIWCMKDWNSLKWVKEHVIPMSTILSSVPEPIFPTPVKPIGIIANATKLILHLTQCGQLVSYDFQSKTVTPLPSEALCGKLRSFIQYPHVRGESCVMIHAYAREYVDSLVSWL
ncbi:hypothetical protein Nepgr_019515 [Nepenthes gracilis]|uniref:F-box domain-containing protein n=1 Tax=Nepenthes gracilis TaxID=150966 RepID=A0AAD3SW00_NEPGR|nr:hypothetical protein Nepgr_019515 [Nepenthes gracilis]